MTGNYIKVMGKGINFHENTTINFNGAGMVLGVSLNISEDIIDFLPPSRVSKGNKLHVYFVEHQIASHLVDVFYVQKVHDYLLRNAMINIREAKSAFNLRQANLLRNGQKLK